MSPTLSNLVKVVHGEGDFASKLVSLVDREPGTRLCAIEGAVLVNQRAYTSVQVSEDCDMELKSDLVFCNHSCDPSVVFDTAKLEVRVGERPLKRGQDLTFFYPSTEWDMTQPFQCNCGASKCLGMVQGAQYLDSTVLTRYWLNPHIHRLLDRHSQNEQAHDQISAGMATRSTAIKA